MADYKPEATWLLGNLLKIIISTRHCSIYISDTANLEWVKGLFHIMKNVKNKIVSKQW